MHPGDAPGLGVDIDEALARSYDPAICPCALLDGTCTAGDHAMPMPMPDAELDGDDAQIWYCASRW